jgi:hypothetical protein
MQMDRLCTHPRIRLHIRPLQWNNLDLYAYLQNRCSRR